MRASTLSGNSRFTCAPSVIRENEVRVHVSLARSAQKVSGVISRAVRHTPLTAMLLPCLSSFAESGSLHGNAVIVAIFNDADDSSDFFNQSSKHDDNLK